MKNRISLSLSLFCGSLILFSSCASAPTKLKRSPPETPPKTGVLMHAVVQVGGPTAKDFGCRLHVQSATDPKKIHELVVYSGEPLIAAELPPGSYRFHKLDCQEKTYLDLPPLSEGPFRVWPGKLSYAGAIRIEEGKNSLGDNVVTIGRERGAPLQHFFVEAVSAFRTPPTHLVNAYTGLPIGHDFVTYANGPDGAKERELALTTQILLPESQTSQALEGPKVEKCIREETQANPVRLGELTATVDFQNTTFKSVEWSRTPNTYRPDFRKCVDNVVKSHKLNRNGKIRYTFRFTP